MNEGHFDPELQKLKQNDPNKDASKMANDVAGKLLGVPEGTSMMNWPRKPLSPPTKGTGHAKSGKASKGHSRSMSRGSKGKMKHHNYGAGWD